MKRITNPRQLAVLTLGQLEEGEDFLREVLDLHLKRNSLSALDQGLYTELVYGTVRMQKNIDYVLRQFSKRPLEKLKTSTLNNLRVAAYQILYLDRVPDSAAVNEGVQLARLFEHQGTANFTNAVLRQVVRNKDRLSYPDYEMSPVEHLALKYSFPKWIITHWLKMLGQKETLALCKAMNEQPEVHLRVNTLRIEPLQLAEYFKSKGFLVKAGLFAPDVLKVSSAQLLLQDKAFENGLFYIQNESSVLAGHALQVKPGQLVYDLCSAPGGKTTHLAQLMENEGEILAFDVNATRLTRVAENCSRLGISCVKVRQGDAAQPLNLLRAQRVLVDAPCSGLGTMRHRPDIRWRKSPKDVEELVAIQQRILRQAADYVEQGGLLLYSTCTLTEEENQGIAKWFLANHPQFKGESLPHWFPPSSEEPSWFRTFFPHRHQLDGFFIALFKRC